uniref:3-oxoacyl-acyl-carrier-protein reductase n=1 Tax=Angomonas desouzai TaxID=59800 RepID=T1YT28_9TRYP|nr:3-oxoacyl-acyl-carrier-protein reductase [Angomonas desouzai]
MSGKVGLLTGSTSALGRAVARRLTQQHHLSLACVSRRVQPIEALPAGCHPFQADLQSSEQCDALCKLVKDQLGPISVMVNCAGVTQNKLHVRTNDQDYDLVFNTNVRGGLNITKSALRHGGLLQCGDGSVIHVGSVVGLHGNAGQVLYSASKAALSASARSWAKEYGAKNIRFNVVAPGLIDGEGMGQTLSEAQRESWRKDCPLGRLATVEDVADVIVSVLQCSFVNGQTISVDGGAY